MKNNIDEDIKYLKNYKYDNEVRQAIDNVVSELEEKIEQIKVLENNNRVLDISLGRELETHKDTNKELSNLKWKNEIYVKSIKSHKELIEKKDKELEIYKKIVEKLSSKLNEAYFEQNDFWLFFEKEILKGIEADYGYVGDVIIDWAREEVENEQNNNT